MSTVSPNRSTASAGGMSRTQARTIEYTIIALCVIALALIFQPFDIRLFSVGAGLVVVAGLAFNLIPFAHEGRPVRDVVRVAAIVLITLLVVTALAIGSALLYGEYLKS